MEKAILIRANREIKKSRPTLPANQVCQTFHTMDLLEIGFLSKQCRNDAAGICIMCDYGCAGDTYDNDTYINEMRKILSEHNGDFKCLLLCTNGSFMDEYQISSSLFNLILTEVSNYNIPEVEIETHYTSVDRKKLEAIKQLLGDNKVSIELGLETSSPIYQEYIIMKHIDLGKFDEILVMIKQFGFDIELNIMLGLPFLSEKEQLEDAQKTIRWAFERNCKPVIFPMNIKPFTLLSHMYETGHYTPISHWLAIFLLDSVPVDRLDRVTMAWYGNREEIYGRTDKRTIFPMSCSLCHNLLMDFYGIFNEAKCAAVRKKTIKDLISRKTCECLEKQVNRLESPTSISFEDRYARYTNALINEFGEEQ